MATVDMNKVNQALAKYGYGTTKKQSTVDMDAVQKALDRYGYGTTKRTPVATTPVVQEPERKGFGAQVADTLRGAVEILSGIGDTMSYGDRTAAADVLAASKNDKFASIGAKAQTLNDTQARKGAETTRYTAERAASGAAKSAQDFINYFTMVSQRAGEQELQNAANSLAAVSALTGSEKAKQNAESMQKQANEVKEAELIIPAKFGTKYSQNVENKYDVSDEVRSAAGVAETIGYMAPAALSQYILPGSSLFVMGASAAGNAAEEALADGASKDRALTYGTAVGVLEALTEKAFDGVAGIFGKGTFDEWIEGTVKNAVKSEAGQRAVLRFVDALGEGAEEFVTELGNRLVNEVIVDTDERDLRETFSDATYSGLMGIVVSGIMQAAGSINTSNPTTAAGAVIDNVKAAWNKGKAAVAEMGTKKAAPEVGTTSVYTKKKAGATPSMVNASSETDTRTSKTTEPVRPALTSDTTIAQTTPGVKSDNTTPQTQNVSNELPDTSVGARSVVDPYVEKQNQQNSTQSAFTAAERRRTGLRPSDSTHRVVTDAEADRKATLRLDFDFEGELADLRDRQDWDKEDTVVAQLALRRIVENARKTGDYTSVVDWNKTLNAHTSAQGQALQANARFALSPERVIADAAETLSDAGVSGAEFENAMDDISQMAYEYDTAAKANDINALANIVRDISKTRRTGTFFKNEIPKEVDWALNHIVENNDVEFMQGLAASSLSALSNDYVKPTIGQRILTWRRNAMLSKASTTMRNLVSNNVFDPLDSISRNISVPLDVLLSKYTGTRSVAVDKSWFSEAKRKGAIDGLAKSIVEVGLDLDASNDTGRYETGSSRTNKMSGGTFSRMMSTWEKWTGYTLNTTDAFQKGGISAEVQRGLQELYDKGLISDADFVSEGALQEALYRTFQDETALSKLSLGARKAFDNIKVGGIGLGEFNLPFAKTPANLGSRALEYSPAGLAKSVYDIANVMAKAKTGTLTAAEQAKAVQGIGRGVNGTALTAAAVALALSGLMNVLETGRDDEDKDKTAVDKQSGLKGTQLNLSAIKHWASGGDTEWRDDDVLMEISFLEPLNALLTTGGLIAEDIENGDASIGTVLQDSLSGTIQAVLDMPVMQTFADVANAYEYAEGNTTGERATNAALEYAGSQVSSFIPNALKGIAQGTDDTQRNQYSGDSLGAEILDSVKAGVPGLRQTLPAKKDSFGNTMENEGGWLNFFNSTLLPGSITRYKESDAVELLNDIYAATGETSIYPDRNAPEEFNNNRKKYTLSDSEQAKYQKSYGEIFEDALEKIKDRSDEMTKREMAILATYAETYATEKAKQEVVEDRGDERSITGDAKRFLDAVDALDKGIDVSDFIAVKEYFAEAKGENRQDSIMSYIDGLNLNDTQKDYLFLLEYSKKNLKKAPWNRD